MTQFGLEMVELVLELAGVEFASAVQFNHVTRTANVSTGAVETATNTQAYVGAFSEPATSKLFDDGTLRDADTMIVMPHAQFVEDPEELDTLTSGTKVWRVIKVSRLQVPGGPTGNVVTAGWALALKA